MIEIDFKIKLRIYLLTAWALATAENEEERQEILKIFNEFLNKKGDD